MNEFEQIENYLNGSMSASEHAEFEKLMEQNKDLKSEVLLQEQMNDVLLDKFLLQEKAFMQNFNYQQQTTGWYKYLFAGLSVLSLLSIPFFINTRQEADKVEQQLIVEKNNLVSDNNEKNPQEEIQVPIVVENKVVKTSPLPIKITSKEEITVSEKVDFPSITPKNKEIVIVPKKEEVVLTTIINQEIVKTSKQEIDIIKEDPCKTIKMNLSFEITKSCKNEETGEILIKAKSTYEYSLNQERFSKQSNYSHLTKGNYIIEIKDENNCVEEHEVFVGEKQCIEAPVYSFSESVEGGFEFSLLQNQKPYFLTIISKRGEKVFTKQIENSEWWDGTNLSGDKLLSGYYIVLIQFEGETVIKGSITVLP